MDIVFGPVPSRRLGRSLGINIIPDKICTLDCVYCEVGRTTALTLKRAPYIPVRKVITEFLSVYPQVKNQIDVITITGGGEPTLNSDIEEIIKELKSHTEHPLAVLTNSTLIGVKDVSRALMPADIVVPSLDAGAQGVFEAVDRPHPSLDITTITQDLADFSQHYQGRLFLEILLVKGVNDSIEALEQLAEAAQKIRHEKIQISTVFRPPAWENTTRLTNSELEDAFLFLSKKGLQVEPVGAFSGRASLESTRDNTPELLENLLKLRPVTLTDITAGLMISEKLAISLLKEIAGVKTRSHDNEDYFYL